MRIFVQITSYRDPELQNTIYDCVRRAKKPENLYFGVCWQRSDDEDARGLLDNNNIRIADFSWKKSEGSGWARSIAQTLYKEEEYTLHIDSHHRFQKGWDEELISMLEGLNSDKAIISSFAGAYRAPSGEKLSIEPYKISTAGFDEDKVPIIRPDYIGNWENLQKPIRARFLCGHYLFAKGSFCTEYRYDPEVYFEGQDVSLSARCFTMGYEMFHPNKNLIWHEYTRGDKKKHWSDHTEAARDNGEVAKSWQERNTEGKKRVKQLLGIEDYGISFGQLGLGSSRKLIEYQIYSGIDFPQQVLHPSASKSEEPSTALIDEETWSQQVAGIVASNKGQNQQEHSLEISWAEDEIEHAEDYEFWFFGFHDDEGKQIYRKDLNWVEDRDILEFKKTSKEVSFKSDKEPKSCIIWPYSKSKGWLRKIETIL